VLRCFLTLDPPLSVVLALCVARQVQHASTQDVCCVVLRIACRCFLTLTQALALGYGGNPYGPAGTGKTESVKALGAALGRQVSDYDLGRISRQQSYSPLPLLTTSMSLLAQSPAYSNEEGSFLPHCTSFGRPILTASVATPSVDLHLIPSPTFS
jgi:hypothetical protein